MKRSEGEWQAEAASWLYGAQRKIEMKKREDGEEERKNKKKKRKG